MALKDSVSEAAANTVRVAGFRSSAACAARGADNSASARGSACMTFPHDKGARNFPSKVWFALQFICNPPHPPRTRGGSKSIWPGRTSLRGARERGLRVGLVG